MSHHLQTGGSTVDILRGDCSLWASWGLHATTTISIDDLTTGEPTLVNGLTTDRPLERSTNCPPR